MTRLILIQRIDQDQALPRPLMQIVKYTQLLGAEPQATVDLS